LLKWRLGEKYNRIVKHWATALGIKVQGWMKWGFDKWRNYNNYMNSRHKLAYLLKMKNLKMIK